MSKWSILYRGPLSSCNYSCGYCPFAKTTNTRDELEDDAEKLNRFVAWVATRSESISILFTPWGEALFHQAYQDAITRLSHLPHVRRVAIQTNLSCRLDWLEACQRDRVALWATYHPTQTSRTRFLAQCQHLDRIRIRHSVGVVGFKEQFVEITQLRRELNRETYLWINANKRETGYYSTSDIERFCEVDSLFAINAVHHPSRGKACRAGASVFAVDGEGVMRRCHFIKHPIGNIYEEGFEEALREPLNNELNARGPAGRIISAQDWERCLSRLTLAALGTSRKGVDERSFRPVLRRLLYSFSHR